MSRLNSCWNKVHRVKQQLKFFNLRTSRSYHLRSSQGTGYTQMASCNNKEQSLLLHGGIMFLLFVNFRSLQFSVPVLYKELGPKWRPWHQHRSHQQPGWRAWKGQGHKERSSDQQAFQVSKVIASTWTLGLSRLVKGAASVANANKGFYNRNRFRSHWEVAAGKSKLASALALMAASFPQPIT